MKCTVFVLSMLLLVTSCKNKREESNQPNESANEGGIELLEEQVNRVHDEVMPKMSDIYKWKTKLKDLDTLATVSEERKQEIQQAIGRLDSAYDGMMNWMHQYNPEGHKAEEEAAREYFENQMEKVKKVKEDMLEAIEKARAVIEEKNEDKRQ